MKKHILFADYLFTTSFEGKIDNQKIIEYCKELQKEFPNGEVRSNRGGWQQPVLRGKCEEIDKLFNLIEFELLEITKDHFRCDETLRVSNSWFNLNKRHDYNVNHTHPGCLMAGVYYINQTDESGYVSFNRHNNFQYGIDAHLPEKYLGAPYTSDQFKTIHNYNPKQSDFICFPAFLDHGVSPNETDHERLIIAMNFHVEGNLRNNVL